MTAPLLRFVFATMACVLAASARADQTADLAESSARLIADHVCAQCHGPRGYSKVPAYPNLAAQPPEYLAARIKAFRTRPQEPKGHDEMLGMSAAVDGPTLEALVRYYASEPPVKGRRGSVEATRRGRLLYANGLVDRGVPACLLCHGENAEGHYVVPRLAGQHAVYLTRQMRVIQSKERETLIMHAAINGLTPEQIRALALYLQAQ